MRNSRDFKLMLSSYRRRWSESTHAFLSSDRTLWMREQWNLNISLLQTIEYHRDWNCFVLIFVIRSTYYLQHSFLSRWVLSHTWSQAWTYVLASGSCEIKKKPEGFYLPIGTAEMTKKRRTIRIFGDIKSWEQAKPRQKLVKLSRSKWAFYNRKSYVRTWQHKVTSLISQLR